MPEFMQDYITDGDEDAKKARESKKIDFQRKKKNSRFTATFKSFSSALMTLQSPAPDVEGMGPSSLPTTNNEIDGT